MKKRKQRLKPIGILIAIIAFLGFTNTLFSQVEGNGSAYEIELGIASYSLRNFSQEQALDMALRCGVHRITFKSMHLPLDSDNETIKKAVALSKEIGVSLYGAGVVKMRSKEEVDQAFEYAKAAELEMIICVPYPAVLEYVEEKVKEYDIKIAIHNHGPGDDLYPSAAEAYNAIKNMDTRMGLCLDIGHTKRINRDPEQDLRNYFDRIFDIHIKDVTPTEDHPEGFTCIIGRGEIDIVAFLKAVCELDYQGTLALEYEVDKEDPLPGMMESFGYIRGVLASFNK